MDIVEKAPAKINLTLNVIDKRADGFHEMRMVMTSIDLADHLTFTERNDSKITLSSNTAFMPLNKKNIVYQAARILKEKFDVQSGVNIVIDKQIPIAAGLGGGSSDAAATLRGLNRLWELNLNLEELAVIGEELGSDVPFCIYNKTAYATGRGEVINLIKEVPQCWVILVKPPKGISSWTVFGELDLKEIPQYDYHKMIEAINLNDYDGMVQHAGNALEDISIRQQPDIKMIKEKMKKFGADIAVMSGTGPTVYGLTQQYSKALRIVNGLKGFCKEVYLVRTLK
ncbi:4-(cytidine 5'-diphospho)-2-C-methyl-D-erythritol kinase [Marinilactibacillus sp. 15R]|uniref:4-diphosphocytidyl-2-C-methyl-D-erythritol kinase n=1 Tax=Marinilactibacillus piezotolerans TaxID=258723 RepID=A0A1I3ZJR1_9LACT|nr:MULTISPECIES: 4-(cytidine 5'-diphospho)-2-C-methyl-D-erythritol kinase [Marinilactibacillus]API87952.1 4-(cytidine 5'-diphospho)-2-C-methyl-D-erythritol kinase [Marinilactibacillus sp. 15R]SFK43789.1 4-diphosphocytidyl-2-C-methyl-D-erythritol kinase [Marinilactibacillus piezotolerans]